MMKSLVIAVLSVASAAAFAPVSVPKVGSNNSCSVTLGGAGRILSLDTLGSNIKTNSHHL
jgi:hypothetical protein